jgi:hypothetical protein
MIELKANKQYIIQSNRFNSVRKIEVLEITDTTYLIINLDNIIRNNKERLLIKDFNETFSIIEEMDKPYKMSESE